MADAQEPNPDEIDTEVNAPGDAPELDDEDEDGSDVHEDAGEPVDGAPKEDAGGITVDNTPAPKPLDPRFCKTCRGHGLVSGETCPDCAGSGFA